jgi:hypothetical protein
MVSHDVKYLVLQPLELTYEKVDKISKNPMMVTEANFAAKAGLLSLA